jgi:hypothetical protein
LAWNAGLLKGASWTGFDEGLTSRQESYPDCVGCVVF